MFINVPNEIRGLLIHLMSSQKHTYSKSHHSRTVILSYFTRDCRNNSHKTQDVLKRYFDSFNLEHLSVGYQYSQFLLSHYRRVLLLIHSSKPQSELVLTSQCYRRKTQHTCLQRYFDSFNLQHLSVRSF